MESKKQGILIIAALITLLIKINLESGLIGDVVEVIFWTILAFMQEFNIKHAQSYLSKLFHQFMAIMSFVAIVFYIYRIFYIDFQIFI